MVLTVRVVVIVLKELVNLDLVIILVGIEGGPYILMFWVWIARGF